MTQRINQFSENIHHLLSEAIQKELEVPLDIFISLTHIDVSPDLKNATVRISVFPSNKQGTALHFLRKNATLLKSCLAKKLYSKIVPHLSFVIDEQEAHAHLIDDTLDTLS